MDKEQLFTVALFSFTQYQIGKDGFIFMIVFKIQGIN
ncbi:MAG: hypothetical protein ACI8RP_001506 [Urechidicola sp.]|jgi:hypothetical protein